MLNSRIRLLKGYSILRFFPQKRTKIFGSSVHLEIVPSLVHRNLQEHFKRLLFLCGGTTLAFVSFVQAKEDKKMSESTNPESIIHHADQLYDENHFSEVLETLTKSSDQNSSEIRWRKARVYFQLSKTAKDKTERSKLIRDAYEEINEALKADENNFAIHKWMSIIKDAYAELEGIKSRISELENVKKHMLKAVELNPGDPTSWYLLGSFEFGLAEMPWYQRTIVSTIFASPPNGSYETALEYFKKAETLKEGFYSMNWLMLGKTYLALKDTENAKLFLQKAANCRVLNEDDKNCKEEAAKLLKKL